MKVYACFNLTVALDDNPFSESVNITFHLMLVLVIEISLEYEKTLLSHWEIYYFFLHQHALNLIFLEYQNNGNTLPI